MGNKAVFTLAAVLMLLFFWLSNYDHYFFLLHFLESLIYLVILLLLFYELEEWAYVMAFVAPLLWMIWSLLWGVAVAGLKALGQLIITLSAPNPADALTGAIFVAALGLTVASGYAYRKEIWGTPGVLRPAVLSILLVGLYFAGLVFVMLRMALPGS